MAQDTIEFPAAQPMTTASLVIAVLESRRMYQRALALARRLLLDGSPMGLTWGDDAEMPTTGEAPASPRPFNRPMRQHGYPAFHAVGIGKGRRNRHGLRVMPSGAAHGMSRGVSVPNASE
jgi:hypothetical protein